MRTTWGETRLLRALCVAPHPDDAEIGAGGTLATLARNGYPVGIVELTAGEMGTLGTPSLREQECVAAARILGLAWRAQLDLPDGQVMDGHESAVRLAEALRASRPRVLLIPHPGDRHPDHTGAYHLARRAAHLAGLAKADVPGEPYRVPRILLYQGNAPIEADVLVDVEAVMDVWAAAIRAHASQFTGPAVSETVTPEIVERRRARLAYWGTFAGRRYCEAFATDSPLLLDAVAL